MAFGPQRRGDSVHGLFYSPKPYDFGRKVRNQRGQTIGNKIDKQSSPSTEEIPRIKLIEPSGCYLPCQSSSTSMSRKGNLFERNDASPNAINSALQDTSILCCLERFIDWDLIDRLADVAEVKYLAWCFRI
jgi:hypothetical protein